MKNALKYLICMPAAAWLFLIWKFSAEPATNSTETSNDFLFNLLSSLFPSFVQADSATQQGIISGLSLFARKGAHMFLYFILALLLCFALWQLVRQVMLRPWLVLALCAICAGIDEYHQTFVPGRTGKVTDVLVDLVGALLALGFVAVVSFIARRRRIKA